MDVWVGQCVLLSVYVFVDVCFARFAFVCMHLVSQQMCACERGCLHVCDCVCEVARMLLRRHISPQRVFIFVSCYCCVL